MKQEPSKPDNNNTILIKESGVSMLKSLFGTVPTIGTALNEIFFEGRSRVKQERINRFIKSLEEYMKTVSPNQVNFDYIKSEEFGDIFESILIRVAKARQEEKISRFRRVLISEIQNPSYSNHSETFLDIISNLEELQIEILINFEKGTQLSAGLHEKVYFLQKELEQDRVKLSQQRELSGKGKANDFEKAKEILDQRSLKVSQTLKKLTDCQKFFMHESVNVKLSLFSFYLQDLVSKALLRERIVPRFKREPPFFKIIEITKYGEEFLKFVSEAESN